MKKIIALCLFMTFFSAGAFSVQYQIVDIYICEEGAVLAELSAKAIVSRKELYRASYCDCEGGETAATVPRSGRVNGSVRALNMNMAPARPRKIWSFTVSVWEETDIREPLKNKYKDIQWTGTGRFWFQF